MTTDKKSFFSFRFYKDIGIDLGTANTLVYMKGKGIIIEEPSVVAIDTFSGQLLAVGNRANEMIGRTPASIIAIRPLKDGVIADFNYTKLMLKYFISKALHGMGISKPRLLIGVPLGITQVEKRSVIEAAVQAGAKEVYLIDEPVAAAVGAGLPVDQPRGSMVVDIGGGTTEVAILSLGGIVVGRSIRIGGDEMNQAILRFLRRIYNLEIGERTAERVKIESGYAFESPQKETTFIKGMNLATGLPISLEINLDEISQALSEPLQAILESIHTTLEKTPPELAADIMEKGIVLTGGGSLLKNIDQYIAKHVRIPISIAENPLTCVARGTGKALENPKLFKLLTVNQSGQVFQQKRY